MLLNAYCVYDKKAFFFNMPFFSVNDGVAMRIFLAAAEDPQTDLYKHPEDFVLFRIGTFDNETGEVIASMHVNLGSAKPQEPSNAS